MVTWRIFIGMRQMKKLTRESFIEKAVKVHGNRYDYGLVVYENSVKKVKIICQAHGVFLQTPNRHLYSNGCSACRYETVSKKTRRTEEEFISLAKEKHNGKYSYEECGYATALEKVKISCPEHGVFHQEANAHLKGAGCYQCGIDKNANRKRSSHAYFVKKAIAIHGETYSYGANDYTGRSNKVTVTCKIHGDFLQTAGDHLCGCGCPACGDKGFSINKRGFLYVLKSDKYFKVGISNNVLSRMRVLRRETPFPFSLFYVEAGYGRQIADREKRLHKEFTSARLSGFDGATEWFIIEPEFMERIANDR